MLLKYLRFLLIGILLAYPALCLVEKSANNFLFNLLILVGLVAMLLRFRFPDHFQEPRRIWVRAWPLSLSMASVMAAVLVHQTWNGNFYSKPYDVPFHLAAFGIFLWLFLQLKNAELKLVHWGAIAGVLGSLAIIYLETQAGAIRPGKVHELAIIPFSNHAMLLAFLVFLSIKLEESPSKVSIALKSLVLCAGLYITFLSQTRGGWPALLLYAGIGSVVFFRNDWKKISLAVMLFLSLLITTALLSQNIQKRVESVRSDVQSYMDGSNRDTSVGIRLQYWHSSWTLIKEGWPAGIGFDTYKDEIKELAQQNIISTQAASLPHPHNELLFQTIRYGIAGLISMLLVLLVPLLYFGKFIHHPDEQIRATAWMGSTVCLAFLTFGLTDVVLVWRHTTTFYAFFLAVFFAHIFKRLWELESTNSSVAAHDEQLAGNRGN